MTERTRAARRGAVRVFTKFETLVNYLRGIGICQINVNASNYDAGTFMSPRNPLISLPGRQRAERVEPQRRSEGSGPKIESKIFPILMETN